MFWKKITGRKFAPTLVNSILIRKHAWGNTYTMVMSLYGPLEPDAQVMMGSSSKKKIHQNISVREQKAQLKLNIRKPH